MRSKRALRLHLLAVGCVVAATAEAQVWELDNRLLELSPSQSGAQFGTAVAVGDFDGDGLDDVAVGAPGWDADATSNAGLVRVYRANANRTFGFWLSTWLNVDESKVGAALAAADFDGDGLDELAIGVPGADVTVDGTSYSEAGEVWVSGWNGAEWQTDQVLSQRRSTMTLPEELDHFGQVLAVGNFNGDGFADLAVGVPFEDWQANADVGVVHVFLGSGAGLDELGQQGLRTGSGGVLGTPAANDVFGWSLAAGDFNGDDYHDLAIGAPFRDASGFNNAGEVHVLYGSDSGLTSAGNELYEDGSFSGSSTQTNDNFGYSLVAANLNQSLVGCLVAGCYADLAIGVSGQNVGGAQGAGKVVVAYGSGSGLSTNGETILTQANVTGALPEVGDFFGDVLAVGYLGKRTGPFANTIADLAVGAPLESDEEAGLSAVGFVHLFFGSGLGPDQDPAAQEQAFSEQAGFLIAPATESDRWGAALAIGDFDGDGWGDVVVGAPGKTRSDGTECGAVQVLYGALFSEGFESGGLSNW